MIYDNKGGHYISRHNVVGGCNTDFKTNPRNAISLKLYFMGILPLISRNTIRTDKNQFSYEPINFPRSFSSSMNYMYLLL